ncbi:MAG TPA: methyltransferase domain-containing protein [Gaiellaceae bacterium]|nr:methyltransferase domain-containing protein [Gaiellaceae bacterium]
MSTGLRRAEGAVERLDLPDAETRTVAASLDDLARINRLFGGTRLTLRALERILGRRGVGQVTLLDAGSGGGDMAAAMARWARRRGFVPRVVAVDASPKIAALAFDRVGDDVELRVGDVRALELEDESVDVATCSLLLHHLEPDDAITALRELGRVARRGVVVNDLVRSRVGLVGAHAVARLLTRNPITRHDAVLSVHRAYTRRELLGLVEAAGLRPLDVRGWLGYRVAIVADPQ